MPLAGREARRAAPDDAVQAADLLVGASRWVPAGQLLGRADLGQAGPGAVLLHGRSSFHQSRGTALHFWSKDNMVLSINTGFP